MPQTLLALADVLADGRATARGLVEASLDRIGDPSGEGSRVFLSVDAEGALASADAADMQRRRRRHPSPFAGIPVSVKDLFDLAGEVTTAGSAVLRDAPPATRDAPAIARLKATGFIVLGRTNMTEFAYSGVGLNPHYGTPRSVWDRATGRIPGGSSSGAAVSVADGMCALGIGTDTGGSCRIPASYNGVVGYKPSVGRVPTEGAFPLSWTLDSVGPLANSVACCAIADAIMAGETVELPLPRPASSLRLGLARHLVLEELEPAVATAFDRALAALSKAGAKIVEIEFKELADLPAINARGGISAVEAFCAHREMIAHSGDRYDQRVRKRIESGASISAPDFVGVLRERQHLIAKTDRLTQGLDALILPTTPNLPPPISALETDEAYARLNFLSLRNTFIGNFLHRCAISLPMHKHGEPPTGFMLMAPWGADKALFEVAAGVEATLAA
ncbi:MAG: amidase [Parvibaculaceae bacterium]